MLNAGISAQQSCNAHAIPMLVGGNLYAGHPEQVDEQIVLPLQSFSTILAATYCHNFLVATGHVDASTGRPHPRRAREAAGGARSGKERLSGHGHRVYRTADPRNALTVQMPSESPADEVVRDPFFGVALALDKAASEDEYFVSKKLFPDADLFAAFAYQTLSDFSSLVGCSTRAQRDQAQDQASDADLLTAWG
ncbi:hypothetical protein F4780DRAFT_777276 [Xylariomycetidae sp. FL0641]|nr:hypothetical protein F4780DRAFT_777276 [Xylariomycetidae sp. FL0641]